MDILVFNVQLGQCIFFYPRKNTEYGLMVDCGNTPTFEPVDKLIQWNLLPKETIDNKTIYKLKNLTLTNYDQDHFSGLPYLKSKVKIETVRLPKNLSSDEVLKIKEKITQPIKDMVEIMKTYTSTAQNYSPPHKTSAFYLGKDDFPDESIETNKLSQIVFVEYNGTCVCIPGDLTSPAWDKMLQKADVKNLLLTTDIFVASHHGREDGYNANVFNHCKPECIILSDKYIVHGTQEGMSSLYSKHVTGNGIILNADLANPRKVLTTRSDGNIWIRIEDTGLRTYKTTV
jgi:hypothetical protein